MGPLSISAPITNNFHPKSGFEARPEKNFERQQGRSAIFGRNLALERLCGAVFYHYLRSAAVLEVVVGNSSSCDTLMMGTLRSSGALIRGFHYDLPILYFIRLVNLVNIRNPCTVSMMMGTLRLT